MKIQNLSFHIDLIPWIFFRSSKVFSKFPKEVTLINSGLCGFSWSHSLFAQVRFPSFQIRLMIQIFTAYSWWSLLTKDLYFRKLPIRFWLLSIFQMSNVLSSLYTRFANPKIFQIPTVRGISSYLEMTGFVHIGFKSLILSCSMILIMQTAVFFIFF